MIDPEVVVIGDFLKEITSLPPAVMRARHVYTVSKYTMPKLISGNINLDQVDFKHIKPPESPDGEKPNEVDLYIGDYWTKSPIFKWGIHYCLAAPTQYFHELRGYDERMSNYGPDDYCMMKRLCDHAPCILLENIKAIHLYHDRSTVVNVTGYKEVCRDSSKIRNLNSNWGELYDK